MDDEFESAMKVIVIGDGGSGKTSLAQRYCAGVFSSEYKKTLGVDFLERTIEVDETTIRLMLWDTAGQEEFDALTKAYYRGAEGAVLVFSTTDRESFLNIEKWKKKVEFECGTIPMALVQNKVDLIEHKQIQSGEMDRMVKKLNIPLFLTSAKKNIGIDQVFLHLAKSYLQSLNEPDEEVVDDEDDGIGNDVSSLPVTNGQSSLFKKYSNTNKFMKKSKLRVFRDHFYPSHVYMSGHPSSAFLAASPSSMTAPLLQQNRHYRYKSRFHLIPARNTPLHPPVIIRHPPQPSTSSLHHSHPLPHLRHQQGHHPHHPPFKYLTIRDNQGHLLRPHRKSHSNKHSFFNNCWLL